jgi:Peptidase of plants and bacteria
MLYRLLLTICLSLSAEAVEVTLQLPEAADERLKTFAHQAEQLVKEWEPKVADILASDPARRPKNITIIFREMSGVAYWDGKAINVSTAWVASHPKDVGLVVHELTHVLQGGYHKTPSWWTEGMADYVRFGVMEDGHFGIKIDPTKQKPRDSYRVTGYFFFQAEKKYPGLIKKLHETCAAGRDPEATFKTHCDGKTVEEVWTDLVVTPQK